MELWKAVNRSRDSAARGRATLARARIPIPLPSAHNLRFSDNRAAWAARRIARNLPLGLLAKRRALRILRPEIHTISRLHALEIFPRLSAPIPTQLHHPQPVYTAAQFPGNYQHLPGDRF